MHCVGIVSRSWPDLDPSIFGEHKIIFAETCATKPVVFNHQPVLTFPEHSYNSPVSQVKQLTATLGIEAFVDHL
jgi:hypothetical protein